MTKVELVAALSEKANVSKVDAEHVLDALATVVAEELKKGVKVKIADIGILEVKDRPAREGRSPKGNHEVIHIPATRVVRFKVAKALKEKI